MSSRGMRVRGGPRPAVISTRPVSLPGTRSGWEIPGPEARPVAGRPGHRPHRSRRGLMPRSAHLLLSLSQGRQAPPYPPCSPARRPTSGLRGGRPGVPEARTPQAPTEWAAPTRLRLTLRRPAPLPSLRGTSHHPSAPPPDRTSSLGMRVRVPPRVGPSPPTGPLLVPSAAPVLRPLLPDLCPTRTLRMLTTPHPPTLRRPGRRTQLATSLPARAWHTLTGHPPVP